MNERPHACARACPAAGLLALAFVACASAARAEENAGAPAEWALSLEAAGTWSNLTGFVQVPLGGKPGTTSPRRPTLHELGIADAAGWDAEGRVRWQHFVVSGGYQWLEPDGSGTLTEPLVSHGVSFAAGSPFQSSLKLDVAHVGAGWNFELLERRLTLRPLVEFALLDYSYSLSSPGARASRAFATGAARLGAEAAFALGSGFAFEFRGVASLPIAHMAQLAEVGGRLSYRLPLSERVRAHAFLGSGVRWIEFDDSQQVPNHISVRTGALLRGGIAIEF